LDFFQLEADIRDKTMLPSCHAQWLMAQTASVDTATAISQKINDVSVNINVNLHSTLSKEL